MGLQSGAKQPRNLTTAPTSYLIEGHLLWGIRGFAVRGTTRAKVILLQSRIYHRGERWWRCAVRFVLQWKNAISGLWRINRKASAVIGVMQKRRKYAKPPHVNDVIDAYKANQVSHKSLWITNAIVIRLGRAPLLSPDELWCGQLESSIHIIYQQPC